MSLAYLVHPGEWTTAVWAGSGPLRGLGHRPSPEQWTYVIVIFIIAEKNINLVFWQECVGFLPPVAMLSTSLNDTVNKVAASLKKDIDAQIPT